MTRLSDTQATLLSTAADRKNRSLLPVPGTCKARGTALDRAFSSLVKRGLAAETQARSEIATWRLDDDEVRIGLVITGAGFAAIGVDDAEAGSSGGQADTEPAEAGTTSRPGGKLGKILAAVEAEDGATIGELAK